MKLGKYERLQSGLFLPSQDEAVPISLCVMRAGNQESLPGYQSGPRKPPDYLLCLVTNGVGWLENKDSHVHLQAGDVFCGFPDSWMAYGTDPVRLLSKAWVGFTGTQARQVALDLNFSLESPVQSIGTGHHGLAQLFYKIRDELIEKRPGYGWRATGLFWQILGILRSNAKQAPPTVGDLIEQAKQYIDIHYAEIESVSQLSKLVGLSRSHFSTTFRSYIGMSPQEYLSHTRITHARKLLTKTSLTVKEVAYTVGYRDPAYFSRLFKARLRVSPVGYREDSTSSEPDRASRETTSPLPGVDSTPVPPDREPHRPAFRRTRPAGAIPEGN